MGWRVRGVGAGRQCEERQCEERCEEGVSEVWGWVGGWVGGALMIHSSPSCQATTAARTHNLAVRQDRRTGGAQPECMQSRWCCQGRMRVNDGTCSRGAARARCASMMARRVRLVVMVLRSQMVLLLCGGQAVVPMTWPGVVSAETADRVPPAVGTGYRNSEPAYR